MTDVTERPPVSRARTALSVSLVALLYLWVFPYHAVVNNPNENVRIYMTVALVDDHTFAINRVESTWGYVNDKAVREGRLYSSKAPGTSYVGAPFYWLLTKVTGRHALPPAHPTPPRPGAPPPKPPLDRTALVYFLRLTGNALPALLFAWFWHRFLDRRTRSPALRDAVFFSSMLGSSLFAYSVVFASHAQNALSFGAALMALTTVRERDDDARAAGVEPRASAGVMFLAGLFGAACTMFEYPAGIATVFVALWITSLAAERRRGLLYAAASALGVAGVLALTHHKLPAALAGALALGLYLATTSWRSLLRLAAAGLGGAIPTGLTLLYHHRCFGNAFKPGYSFLENPTFREETNQGFFGATQFSWEAGLRLWFDPAFGLIPSTPVFLLSLLGFGAYFSSASAPGEAPTRAAVTGRRVMSAGFFGLAVLALVKAARADHPDAFLVYRNHPDVLAGNRPGRLDASALASVDAVADGLDIIDCLNACRRVATLTSLTGFEALMRGRAVSVYGRPFYAGWGLTDDRLGFQRRTRRATVDHLILAALIHYPIYVTPQGWPCEAEDLVQALIAARDLPPPPAPRGQVQRWAAGIIASLDRRPPPSY